IRGGSREPYVILQFVLDFWGRLPRVVIFTQDDCEKYTACHWLRKDYLGQLATQMHLWVRSGMLLC
ncbi:MAG: hypothetical protein SGPRY_009843, partial [Prymnesium sp.]